MPISMSPETLEKRTSPEVTAWSRMSPETRLHVAGTCDRTDADIARDGVRGHVPFDPVEVGVATDRLDVRAAGDLAAQADVAGDGVHAERPEASVQTRVRGRGLELDGRAVGTAARTRSSPPKTSENGESEKPNFALPR